MLVDTGGRTEVRFLCFVRRVSNLKRNCTGEGRARKRSTRSSVPSHPLSVTRSLMQQPARRTGHAQASTFSQAASRDDVAAAFEAIVPVLRLPRCMNCHSTGDFPRQGGDSHRHTITIRRGLKGRGINSAMCSTSHQDHNLFGLHMPPGAPDLALSPPATPMIWEGLTDQRLCELLKRS